MYVHDFIYIMHTFHLNETCPFLCSYSNLNLFNVSGGFLYPLKKSESQQRFFDVFGA